ncbi:translocation protein SEC62-like [Daktulosphaira vitifoliae]|uniref:translocation protein SEC62-like n=1 Tax=Daktulosphaira vitifoliae TaxID=58002 RepID=UPI0021AA169D|nr:translocation protein SEC62-like [Daktulosphaira vitifoliae]
MSDKPTKQEYAIAKWIRKNVQHKKTKFAGHNVEYFTGSKAVDSLLDSKWVTSEKLFSTREEIELYLDDMLKHQFFHRAKKVPISEQELKAMKNKKSKKLNDTDKEDKKKSDKKKKDDESEETSKDDKNDDEKNKTSEVLKKKKWGERKKKSRKIRLEMHMEQVFVDNLDAYVWIYDPIPFYYWVIGTFIVFGGIGICLFPLWPPQVRMGVQYLSIAAAGFLIFIIVLAILRLVLFSIIWILSAGKLHFWLFPNLTEDVGFFASFWPIYTYSVISKKSNKKGKKKKEKLSDDDDEEEEEEEDKLPNVFEDEKKSETEVKVIEDKQADFENFTVDLTPDKEHPKFSEDSSTDTESSSQLSHTGNDFVIVDKQDAQETQ